MVQSCTTSNKGNPAKFGRQETKVKERGNERPRKMWGEKNQHKTDTKHTAKHRMFWRSQKPPTAIEEDDEVRSDVFI